MVTSVAVDDQLVLKAQMEGGHQTKEEAVATALRKYIQWREQLKIITLFGEIEYDADDQRRTGRGCP